MSRHLSTLFAFVNGYQKKRKQPQIIPIHICLYIYYMAFISDKRIIILIALELQISGSFGLANVLIHCTCLLKYYCSYLLKYSSLLRHFLSLLWLFNFFFVLYLVYWEILMLYYLFTIIGPIVYAENGSITIKVFVFKIWTFI